MQQSVLVTEYGAIGDGQTVNTAAIQAALDAAHAAGGGRVVIPPGTFLSGSLQLKSHVELHLQSGAMLKGSPKPADYEALDYPFRTPVAICYAWKSLIWALDAEQIALTGFGIIDGHGDAPLFQVSGAATWEQVANRPQVLYFIRCREVRVSDLTLRNSAFWMQHHTDCRQMRFERLHISNLANHNNDGLDLDNCTDVFVSDCLIESSDDALCLKSMTPGRNERIVISNCILRSHYNALKIGTESAGGVRDLIMTNCLLGGPEDIPHPQENNGRTRGFAGIALESADGAELENIVISNCAIRHVTAPFFIRLENRGTRYWPDAPPPGPGCIRGVRISQVSVRDTTALASSVTGIPGACVEDVALCGITVELPGGGNEADCTTPVPEQEGGYPDCTMFNTNLPASALYLRHVRGVHLADWSIRIASPDARPWLATEDVKNLQADFPSNKIIRT